MYDPIYGHFEEHVKAGDEVWKAGDIVDSTRKVKVGESRHIRDGWEEHSYEAVNAFWNKLYFGNYEAAEHVCREYRRGYTDWLFGMNGY